MLNVKTNSNKCNLIESEDIGNLFLKKLVFNKALNITTKEFSFDKINWFTIPEDGTYIWDFTFNLKNAIDKFDKSMNFRIYKNEVHIHTISSIFMGADSAFSALKLNELEKGDVISVVAFTSVAGANYECMSNMIKLK